MKKFALDTSALFALIESGAGCERVAQIMRKEKFILSFASLLELHYIMRQEHTSEAERLLTALKRAPVLWTFDEMTLTTASRLKAKYKISLSQCMIAAVAISNGAILVHKDPAYEELTGELEMEALPYKKHESQSSLPTQPHIHLS
jgi:predicted nucleic acid-binding protein